MDNMCSMGLESNGCKKEKVKSLEIIVEGTIDKPYFEIRYITLDDEVRIGYGSYDLRNVFGWKEECFEIIV